MPPYTCTYRPGTCKAGRRVVSRCNQWQHFYITKIDTERVVSWTQMDVLSDCTDETHGYRRRWTKSIPLRSDLIAVLYCNGWTTW